MQALPYASPQSSIPRKLFYRINEVAKITGLKPYVLRYWESEFPELSPEKDTSDQRRYRTPRILKRSLQSASCCMRIGSPSRAHDSA
jgi:hypothetical protein